jgi:hypothetical protein
VDSGRRRGQAAAAHRSELPPQVLGKPPQGIFVPSEGAITIQRSPDSFPTQPIFSRRTDS